MGFELHPQLAADTILVREDEDLLLLAMNDRQYPWFIVVPKQNGLSEWHEMDTDLQISVHLYCVALGKAIKTAFNCSKINIAALGNMVSQLHIHVIGRHSSDPCWPKPVWGQLPAIAMSESEQQARIATINEYFNN